MQVNFIKQVKQEKENEAPSMQAECIIPAATLVICVLWKQLREIETKTETILRKYS